MLAPGADGVPPGRAFVYALAAVGGGMPNLQDLIEKEMRVAMILTIAKPVARIDRHLLARDA